MGIFEKEKKDIENEQQPQPAVALTVEQLQELGHAIGRGITESNPDVQDKLEKKRRAELAKQQMMVEVAKAEEEKRRRQASCSHQKENGEYATGGQVLSNGKVLLICTRCAMEWHLDATPENRRLIEAGDLSLHGLRPPEPVLRESVLRA